MKGMKGFVNLLYYIYLNRFREVDYYDKSKIYVLGLLYVIVLIFLYKNTSDYSVYVLLFLSFSQISSIHLNRKDINLLKKNLGNKYRLLLSIDYFILNLPIFFVLLFKGDFLYAIASLSLLLLVNVNKPNISSKTIIPFSIVDPLWVSFLRKYRYNYFFILLSYYIHYQGYSNNNENLMSFSYLIISFIILSINATREKLIFLKISPLTSERYLKNILFSDIINAIYLVSPILVFDICVSINLLVYGLIFLLLVSFIVWFRYIFFFQEILSSLCSLFIGYLIFGYSVTSKNDISQFVILIIVLSLTSFFLFRISLNKIDQLRQ
mgnify:CR=1 FL=1